MIQDVTPLPPLCPPRCDPSAPSAPQDVTPFPPVQFQRSPGNRTHSARIWTGEITSQGGTRSPGDGYTRRHQSIRSGGSNTRAFVWYPANLFTTICIYLWSDHSINSPKLYREFPRFWCKCHSNFIATFRKADASPRDTT